MSRILGVAIYSLVVAMSMYPEIFVKNMKALGDKVVLVKVWWKE